MDLVQNTILNSTSSQWNGLMARMLGVPINALYKYTEHTPPKGYNIRNGVSFSPDWYKALNEQKHEQYRNVVLNANLGQKNTPIRITGISLEGKVFVGMDFSGSRFANGFMSQCVFFNCILSNCDFNGCYIGGCTFRGCLFGDSSFRKANIWKSNIINCGFKDNDFTSADIIETSMMCEILEADFSKATFLNSSLDKNRLIACEFAMTNFIGTSIIGSLFPNCVIGNARMSHCILNKCDFSETDFYNLTSEGNTCVATQFKDKSTQRMMECQNFEKTSRHYNDNAPFAEVAEDYTSWVDDTMKEMIDAGEISLPQPPEGPQSDNWPF